MKQKAKTVLLPLHKEIKDYTSIEKEYTSKGIYINWNKDLMNYKKTYS